MQGKPIGWFEIYVQDMARARAFYEAVFECTLDSPGNPDQQQDMEMWSFPGAMDAGNGASGALVRMEGVNPGAGGIIVYFMCEDCAEEAARAAASGGHVVREKFDLGEYGFAALVNDTEGNLIGLHSMR